ncbi:Spt23-suppressor of ty retrotransposon [Fusarium acuminatum]|uniref:Spt23-suppressor of ty retrotransposon n=1 Tax=Fusarium acuminatum TaxID=5515 RepID=A0ABZ2WHQ7_9HYPO
MTPAATGPGSPLIAGGAMAGGDFNDFSEDELAPNLFDLSNSPDTLQTFDSLSDTKAFLSPQEFPGAQLPDSPNGSYQDSSSESASSKRSMSSKLAINPAEVMMDDDDVTMEWGRNTNDFPTFGDDDTFAFDRNHADVDMYNFGNTESFYDGTFSFETASSSPEIANGENLVTSPQMPTIHSRSPNDEATPKRKKTQGHHKAQSQYSVSSAMNALKTSTSREVSPTSNMIMSHGGSPAAMYNSSSPNNQMDYSRVMKRAMGHQVWPNKMDVAAQSAPDVSHMQFSGQINQPMPMSQHMPMPTQFNFTGRYELTILPTPLKSRVETQIPIKMALSPMPPGITKLHLPAHTISKPKLLHKPAPLEKSPDTLELHVSLVCTSAMEAPGRREAALKRAALHPQGYLPPADDGEDGPQHGGDVRICTGCMQRERKRAARKKIKKPDEEKVWLQDEERRVIVFNTNEVKEWQPVNIVMDPGVSNGTMQVDAPMRIACYCRHHGEKMGFNVIFTIKDYQDRLIAQAMSNAIMITDDHKTHTIAQPTTQQQPSIPEAPVPGPISQASIDASALLPPTPNGTFHMSPSNGDMSSMHRSSQVSYQSSVSSKTTNGAVGRELSRPASPTLGGPMAKKRKSSASRVPNGLTMTRLDASPSPGAQTAQMPNPSSPFAPNLGAFSQADSLFGQPGIPFSTGPPTPSSNDQPGFFNNNRSASMDNLAMAQLYSAPASGHPSRAPSPNGLRNSVVGNPQNQFTQALTSSLYTVPISMNQTRAPPIIHKIIPNEGPKVGGIEVTVLGAAFFQGLEVWFGEQKATTTTFWGESSLVCLLPPSAVAGPVPVTFNRPSAQAAQAFPMGKQAPFFKYVDDNEDKLIRIALSVLGNKMSGNMMDIKDMARRILDDNGSSGWSGGSSAGPSSGGQMYSHAPYAHLESQLLKCLDLIDLDDSQHRTRLDLRRSTGHTMLHLACSLGYHRFVAALLVRGANPNARDKGGFTPLHIAAIHNQSEVVRRLMLNGADPTLRSVSNLSAADVSQVPAVVKTIRRFERQVRSRSSGGSLHSRASSATSLRSLWGEPLTKAHTHDEPVSPDSSEESPEYTSGDFDDEDPDEDSYLSMRRPSGFRQDRERPNLRRQNTGQLEEELAPAATPMAAASAALKEHFQQQLHQFQQSIALQFQNLPHFPQMPQMPALPDYQAPFMRRVQQLMPGMTAPAPRPDGEQPQRWWDTSFKASAPAPPAYEEIYPQEQLDRKQASAATAAVEAEADQKCAALFDQATTTETKSVVVNEATDSTEATELSEITEVTEVKTEELGVLKIGRKNAITKEQQEQFRRAHEVKMKRISSDHNLFFIWIPLLLVMICAMLYSYFPWLFTFVWAFVRSLYQNGLNKTQQLIQQTPPERVVEV